jgi:thioredoxin reductase
MSVQNNKRYDAVVVGGGAAGLSAALALVRMRRSVLVVDSATPRNAPAAHMHNYLSRDGTSPLELLRLGRDEILGYGGEIISAEVASIVRVDATQPRSDFCVSFADGSSVDARRILLASGVVDQLPAVQGLAERWGKDVLHCPYCHGWEVRDQAIGILASGPMAVHSALLFRQVSDDILFFQHTAEPLSEQQREQLQARGIRIVQGRVHALESEHDALTGVRMESGEFVPRQALVVNTRLEARIAYAEGLGLTLSEYEMGGLVLSHYVQVDLRGATNVPGVWAAGNLSDPFGTVIAAAAAGQKAGAALNGDLVEEETALAVAALRDQHAALIV